MKFSIKGFLSKCDQFTDEILNGKPHFCAVKTVTFNLALIVAFCNNFLSHLVIPVTLCNKIILTLWTLSHFVIGQFLLWLFIKSLFKIIYNFFYLPHLTVRPKKSMWRLLVTLFIKNCYYKEFRWHPDFQCLLFPKL